MVFSQTELNLKGRAELLPMVYDAHNVGIMVRPEHPITRHAMTSRGEEAKRLPLCSDLLHAWAMHLVSGNPVGLTKMDPLSSPDLLFAMPDRAKPLCYITPNDVKLLRRPNEKGEHADKLISAWEALINLFFSMTQIMRLCTDYEQINKSPFASYHQHALVSPDTLALSLPDQFQEREDQHNPPPTIHGLFANHQAAKDAAIAWGNEIHACSIKKAARQQNMTYHCLYAGASTDPRIARLDKLDKTSCGLAPLVTVNTPTMDLIADTGVEPQDLGQGMINNQQVVLPYYTAYTEVRRSVRARSTAGPVDTLRHGLLESSDWDEVKFVSEKQVIEQMAGQALAPGIGSKLMANFTRIMRYALGSKDPDPKTPANKPSAVKMEMTSPAALGQEFDGEYEGYVPEGRFVSSMNFVRSYITSFADLLKELWNGKGTNPTEQSYIPTKAPMIFRWFPNESWNPRDWITKRLSLTPRVNYWEDEALMAKVRQIADPVIAGKRNNVGKAQDLQETLTGLFNDKISLKDSHILIWMICLYIHDKLEDGSKWGLAPLYTDQKAVIHLSF